MDSKFDILKKALENGYYNIKSDDKLNSGERHKLKASVGELEKLGYLNNSGNKVLYFITELGKLVVQSGGFDEFNKKKSKSREFEIIAKTFEEIAKIHADTQSNNTLVKYVSIVTGVAIVVQALFTTLLYFTEPLKQPLETLITKQTELNDSLSHQSTRFQTEIDSLKMELHRQSTKIYLKPDTIKGRKN